jgi:hypothetical protein
MARDVSACAITLDDEHHAGDAGVAADLRTPMAASMAAVYEQALTAA